ncbi:MAG: GNAT family N-acetyltransferase [Pseudomonadales bacterium]|nr:GNAT family N-acetyltransferase [Pseudomonadales bacterium]
MSASASFSVKFHSGIADIDALTWNRLAGTDYPFLRHEFLKALEDSGAASRTSGWEPLHALVYQHGEHEPVAMMPLYLKTNSYGEYVFDWSWADAWQRHGLAYYPKLVTAIPFTPCAGPRICVHDPAQSAAILPALVSAVQERAWTLGASGWHLLFPEESLSAQLQTLDAEQRIGCQYQWFNAGFRDFEHFLEKFSSRKRKNIRKERRKIAEAGIVFEILEGADIDAGHWQQFYLFYQGTYRIRGRQAYLPPGFFQRIGALMPENLLLVLARKDDDIIAGALSFKGGQTLYGRYWGCTEEYQFLHFETCYYQGIDYCIRQGLQRFDSGAQGEHKIQRGFEPVLTWSNHWIAHPAFKAAISHFLVEESRYIHDYVARASEFLPFRQEGDI